MPFEMMLHYLSKLIVGYRRIVLLVYVCIILHYINPSSSCTCALNLIILYLIILTCPPRVDCPLVFKLFPSTICPIVRLVLLVHIICYVC